MLRLLKVKVLLLIILLGGNYLGKTQVRKYSNAFLSLGVGARGFGMGDARVATTSDVTAGYWNPAGLTHNTHDLQLGLMHSEYFAGIAKYDYGAVVLPINQGERQMGVSLIRFAVDDIPNTLHIKEPDGSINYNKIRSFSAADYALLTSFAQKIEKVEGLSIGGNVKIIHRSVGDMANAWGMGLDVGMQYEYENWRFGAMGRDITSTYTAWSFDFSQKEKAVLKATDNIIPDNSIEITPPRFMLGAAYSYSFLDNKFSVLPELDMIITTDGPRNVLLASDPFSIAPRFGVEIGYENLVFLRGGVKNYQRATNDRGQETTYIQPNLGVGVQIKQFQIDYALTDVGNQSVAQYSHVFSLIVDINKQAE